MELLTAIKERRSIRKFKSTEVPQQLITEIFDKARWSPSWGNTQPWEFYILTGEALKKVKAMSLEKTAAGEVMSPDVQMPENWPPDQKSRYMEIGKVVLTTLGIKREDKEGRNKYYQDMLTYFNAPCMMLACITKDNVVEYPMLDIGLITQTICLLAHEKGLGTCIMAAAARFPNAIRKIAGIPDDKKIIVGIALGYPDPAYPLNSVRSTRTEVAEFVHFIG